MAATALDAALGPETVVGTGVMLVSSILFSYGFKRAHNGPVEPIGKTKSKLNLRL